MKQLLVIAVLMLSLASCTKQASPNLRPKGNSEVTSKKGKGNAVTLATTATMTLTHNGDGTFSIDYGGATDVVWMFFRWGDSLSVSGNVIPVSSQSFYLNPVTTFPANGSGLFYQSVVVTGTTTPDANGIIGADWVFNYSNVVQ